MENQILKECTRKKVLSICKKLNYKADSFNKLTEQEQYNVIYELINSGYNGEVITHKGFDLLANKFFARKLFRISGGFDSETLYFDSFDDFYNTFKKDIYEDSCYFGFKFSDEMIKKYHLKIEKLNFKSFENDRISRWNFARELRKKNKEDAESSLLLNESLEELSIFNRDRDYAAIKYLDEFVDFKFRDVVFSILLRQNKNEIRETFLNYYCKMPRGAWPISFLDILLIYGVSACQFVIDNLDVPYSYSTNRRIINTFKNFLERYQNGEVKLKTIKGYDKQKCAYCIRTFTDDGKRFPEWSSSSYYLEFDEFAGALNGDLSGALLKNAPISVEQVKKYKTDDSTIFPVLWKANNYKVIKKFDNGTFVVVQKWYDSNGFLITSNEHNFLFFCDFVYFLKNDISDSDFIMLDGIDNIWKIKGLKAKNLRVRSIYQKSMTNNRDSNGKLEIFEESAKNELITVSNFELIHKEQIDNQITVSYISDIHLAHRFEAFKCVSEEDREYVLRNICKNLGETSSLINIIAGDTCDSVDLFNSFFKRLDKSSKNRLNHYFIVLGNHELWNLEGNKYDDIIKNYRDIFRNSLSENFHLLHNNAFYFSDNQWKEITENELISFDSGKLKEITKEASIVIFGGIGFSTYNENFCANNGIYLKTLNRDEEIIEGKRFNELYLKVIKCFKDRNLIVATHMPLADWNEVGEYEKGIVYVSGHNHRNYYFDDGQKRIYSDNQVGYKGKYTRFKTISIDYTYDYFSDYQDGIYEITKKEYRLFYRALNETLMFNNTYKSVIMIKKSGTYAFFVRNKSDELLLLNGGRAQKMFTNDINFFYENINQYCRSLTLYLSSYFKKLDEISEFIKSIGGTGAIHGTIVDIDFFNHLYVNPYDGVVTPYYATSIIDKYTYKNLPSLLKYECPTLFENYINGDFKDNSLKPVLANESFEITENKSFYGDTDIYRISRIIKGLQYMTKYNVVRMWKVPDSKEANLLEMGKEILESMLKPPERY